MIDFQAKRNFSGFSGLLEQPSASRWPGWQRRKGAYNTETISPALGRSQPPYVYNPKQGITLLRGMLLVKWEFYTSSLPNKFTYLNL